MGKIERLEATIRIYEQGIADLKKHLESVEDSVTRIRNLALLRIARDIEMPVAKMEDTNPCVFAGYTKDELREIWLTIVDSLAVHAEVSVRNGRDAAGVVAAVQYFCGHTFKLDIVYNNIFTTIQLCDLYSPEQLCEF